MSNQAGEDRFIYDSFERVFDRERNTWVDGAAAVAMLNDLHTVARVGREALERVLRARTLGDKDDIAKSALDAMSPTGGKTNGA